jgi:hypothetical protein
MMKYVRGELIIPYKIYLPVPASRMQRRGLTERNSQINQNKD